MGGLNLEVFKFGMYLMFPIGIMYYFGTNLDNRFAVPDFWPRAEHSNKIPHDRDELKAEYAFMVKRQRYLDELKRAKSAREAAAENRQNEDQS